MANIIDMSKMRVQLPAADWREAIALSGQVLEEIGSMLGISKERARQIERQAMEKLQKLGAGIGLEDFLNE